MSGEGLKAKTTLSGAFQHDRQVAAASCLRKVKRLAGDERGSNLVEYSVVLMLFLTMIFGVIDFGRAMYAYHFVSSAAREATRYAIVRGSSSPTPASPSDIQDYVMNVPAGIDATQLTVTPTWNPSGSATCSSAPKAPGCVVEVQVSYNFSFLLPFMPKSGIVMTSSSQMVISQ